MREIKFRAWNENKKQMLEFSIDNLFNDRYGTFVLENRGEWVFMQYTGLKDKNGVEVYDRDALLVNGEICYIVWADTEWALKFQCEETPQSIIPNLITIEVIGNIYQNPELLEK